MTKKGQLNTIWSNYCHNRGQLIACSLLIAFLVMNNEPS